MSCYAALREIRINLKLKTVGLWFGMKGVGGAFDIISTIITLILGFIIIYIGLIGINLPAFVVVILGISLVFLAVMSIVA